MIQILLFAGLRERIGENARQLSLPAGVDRVGALIEHLACDDSRWSSLKTFKNLRIAVNQEMADLDTPLHDGDEVAFFPPVTGG